MHAPSTNDSLCRAPTPDAAPPSLSDSPSEDYSSASEASSTKSPVPEFLRHLLSMLSDSSLSELISWEVPERDEPDDLGGGIHGKGKVVVHKPESLQDNVLGGYYRHSKYSSFQRQLNYFGFKKRLHGGKKGKLEPCSFIHENLTEDVESLLTLKRRPPAKKRAQDDGARGEDADSDTSVSITEDAISSSASKSYKKRRLAIKKTEKQSKKEEDSKKKEKIKKEETSKKDDKDLSREPPVSTSMPHQVRAEECSPLSSKNSIATETDQCPNISGASTSKARPAPKASDGPSVMCSNTAAARLPAKPSLLNPVHATLMAMLSTYLPPPAILFNDNLEVECTDEEGVPVWVTNDGERHCHNVDSSLVDLAMIY